MTTLSFQPNPVDMNDLDHHIAYTWRLDNISLSGMAITSASLTFTNIPTGTPTRMSSTCITWIGDQSGRRLIRRRSYGQRPGGRPDG